MSCDNIALLQPDIMPSYAYVIVDCISLLLKHGADARCSDHNGNTPLDLAKDPASKKLLQKALQHVDLGSDDMGNQLRHVM
jgi:ankyrin repeat protein